MLLLLYDYYYYRTTVLEAELVLLLVYDYYDYRAAALKVILQLGCWPAATTRLAGGAAPGESASSSQVVASRGGVSQ